MSKNNNSDAQKTRLLETLSSKYYKRRFLNAAGCPKTLIEALKDIVPHIDSLAWPERIAFGGAFLNGHLILQDCILTPPCQIEYYETKYPIEDAAKYFPQFSHDLIIYEDQDLLVAFKPAGLPCFEAREQRAYNLRRYLDLYNAPFNGTAVHCPSRLDTSASGLVIASRTERMHNALQQIYERRKIDKHYLIELSACPSWDSIVVNAPIEPDPKHPILRRVANESDDSKGAKSALTEFKVLSHRANSSLVLAKPLTGRTHQLRVHSMHLGFPIVGDNFYGGSEAAELHLLSYKLSFIYPLSAEQFTVEVPERLMPAWARF